MAPTENSSSKPAGRAVAKATAGIGILHFLRFIVGFVSRPLIAHNMGLRWEADAYQVATDIVQSFWTVFEKVVNPSFLPQFIASLKEDGEERAWRLASTAIWLLSAILLAFSALGWLLMPRLVTWLSPNPAPGEIALTVTVARLLMPCVFVLGLSSLTYTILNGYKRFAWAAAGDTFWKLGVFVGAFAAFRLYGAQLETLSDLTVRNAAQEAQISDLAVKSLWLVVAGFAVGAVGKLLPHLFAIGSKWRFLKFKTAFGDPRAKAMLLLACPLLLGIAVSESRGFYMSTLAVDDSIAFEAGRFALKISRLVGDTLIQVFPYALSIGIFPFLAEMARERDRQPLTDLVVRSLRVCFFVFVPVTAILIAIRFPLLRALWEGGQMTQADTFQISPPFIAYSLGLVAFACEMMLGQTFYALTRTWTPTLIGIYLSIVWVILAFVGVKYLGWGLVAIAGAEAFSKSLKCVVMWLYLRPHLGKVRVADNARFGFKILVGSVLAAFVAGFCANLLTPDEGRVRMLLAVLVSGSAAMLIFFGVCALLKVEETALLKRFKRRKI